MTSKKPLSAPAPEPAPEPGWDLYRSLLAVLREGSLSGAARALGLTQPTVGRHIDALEQTLGLALFVRSPAGFTPTAAALALEPHAQALAAASGALLRAAAGLGNSAHATPRGTVRISASEVIAVEVLPPILAGLRLACPDIAVELSVSNRIEDLLRRDADIAVRHQRPTQQVLVARRVGVIELGLHAHRDYLARHGTPHDWHTIAQHHTMIGIDRETAFTRSLRPMMGGLARADCGVRSDSDLVHLASIRAGLGIGICQVNLARRDVRLVRVAPSLLSIPLDTWLTMHENLRADPACVAAFDALARGLVAYAGEGGEALAEVDMDVDVDVAGDAG